MISLQFDKDRLISVYRMHYTWTPQEATPHQELLRYHCNDLVQLMHKGIMKRSKLVTIKFTSTQALAFMQLWVGRKFDPADVGGVTIVEMIHLIDKLSKQEQVHMVEVPRTQTGHFYPSDATYDAALNFFLNRS